MREQTHGLDVMAVLEQEAPDELLCPDEFTIRDQRTCRHDLSR
jgi:hypothetical protein